MGQSTTVIPTGSGGAKVQDSIPTNPQKGDLWVDTSLSTPATKWYDGTQFIRISPSDTQNTPIGILTEKIWTSSWVQVGGGTEYFTFSPDSTKTPIRWTVNDSLVEVINVEPTSSGWYLTVEDEGTSPRSVKFSAYSAVESVNHNHSL